MLHLPDSWIWDHWILTSDDHLDIFFLKASRALGHPHRRHAHAIIGHGRSVDNGKTWEILPDAVAQGEASSFDDRSCWTGSAVRLDDGRIRLFYTGTSRRDGEGVFVQRISFADSTDGITFVKTDLPPLEADGRWYEASSNTEGEIAWRDPFVFHDGTQWHMLITARLPHTVEPEHKRRGVIGHATSDDCTNWTIQPPLNMPSRFGHLECSQSRFVDGSWKLIFSCGPDMFDGEVDAGAWIADGESPIGPWDLDSARYVEPTHLYASQLFEASSGGWYYTGFDSKDDRTFTGTAPDPLPWEELALREMP